MNIKEIGENIKQNRIKKGYTQQKLANEINKSLSTVKKYESGETLPPIDILKKISEALDISINSLIEFMGPEEGTFYNKSFERSVFSNIDSIYELVTFKEFLSYLIKTKKFQNEFHLKLPDLSKEETDRLVNDIYNFIKFSCINMTN